MKSIVTVCILFFTSLSFSQDIYKYPLQKSSKLEKTYSATIRDSSSIHLVSIDEKKLKQKIIVPFLVDKNDAVEKLETIVFDKNQKVLSHFSSQKEFAFISQDEKQRNIYFTSINLDSKKAEVTSFEKFDDYDTMIKTEDEVLFIKCEADYILVYSIHKNGTLNKKQIIIPDDYYSLKKFSLNDYDYIDQTKYIKYGSLLPYKLYYSSGILYFSKKHQKEATTIYTINLNDDDSEITKKTFDINSLQSSNDYISYMYDDRVYIMSTNKKNIVISVFEFTTNTLLATYTNESAVFENKAFALEDYLKLVKSISVTATITINETVDDNLLLRLDAVSPEYNYNMGWWMHQQMMQQMMMNNQQNLPRFLPNQDFFENRDFIYSKTKQHIEFVIDKQAKYLENADTTLKQKPSANEKYLDKIRKNRKLEKLTGTEVHNMFYAICYDKKTKAITLIRKYISHLQ